jgi:hypothetical protein
MRIIHFMCPQGLGARIPTSEPKCWMNWRLGSTLRLEGPSVKAPVNLNRDSRFLKSI